MSGVSDIQTAARRVAENIRLTGYGNYCNPADLAMLLPVLDAVARGAEGNHNRLRRWYELIEKFGLDRWSAVQAAIALADAEVAGRMEAGWRAYEDARDALGRAEWRSGNAGDHLETEEADGDCVKARAALDAAVRRMAP